MRLAVNYLWSACREKHTLVVYKSPPDAPAEARTLAELYPD